MLLISKWKELMGDLKISKNISEKIYSKDCFEAIGVSNGYAPQLDFGALGLLGPVMVIQFFETIEQVYV